MLAKLKANNASRIFDQDASTAATNSDGKMAAAPFKQESVTILCNSNTRDGKTLTILYAYKREPAPLATGQGTSVGARPQSTSPIAI